MSTSIIVKISNNFLNKIKKNPSLLEEIDRYSASVLNIDEDAGSVIIKGKDNMSDVLKARDFVIALDNCVSDDIALEILRKDLQLYLIDLKDFFSKEDVKRVMSRIIGEGGKIKARISESTGSHIFITDSKILLIGNYDEIEYARQAIQIIVDGSPFSRLFKYLEKVKREKQLKQIEEYNR
ncbi:MAG TPA: KH domain-containing protein [Geobacterales bacterium]|nr:KH domain-containing protein [Geobacterales bacterium]